MQTSLISASNLTQEYVKERFDYHPDVFLIWRHQPNKSPQWNGKHAGKIAGTRRFDGRCVIRLDDKLYLAYRLIWLWHKGSLPEELDHKDKNATNDRIENLREADRFINNQNTNATGVTKVRNRYWARIYRYGVNTSLGFYDSFEEAHKAYKIAKAVYDDRT